MRTHDVPGGPTQLMGFHISLALRSEGNLPKARPNVFNVHQLAVDET